MAPHEARPIEQTRAIDEERDRALVARVRAGDESALEHIFRQHWDSLYGVAFRYMRAADDAEDVVQGIFLRKRLTRKS